VSNDLVSGDDMSTQIRFLGLAAFQITLPGGRVVMIDPCLERLNPVSPIRVADLVRVDLLLITHLAGDHLGEAGDVAKRFRCPVVCGPEVKYFLTCQGVDPKQFRVLTWNAQTNPNGIRVRAVPSFHASVGLAPDGKWLSGAPMGFILYASDRCRIYHSGDTAIYSDLKLIGELYQPTVGLFCAAMQTPEYYAQNGMPDFYGNEMSGEEGALAAQWLKVEHAICCHYLDPADSADVRKFFAILESLEGPKPYAPKPGETIMISD
jgi:L-ascorbate metabolism protein UlaG (beta-lactamase superfamily)